MKIYDLLHDFKEVNENINDIELNENHYWIYCYVDELEEIKKKLKIRDYNIKQCTDSYKLAKIEFLEEYTFIVFNVLNYNKKLVGSRELYIFLYRNYIITICKDESSLIKELYEDIENNRNCLKLKKNPNSTMLLYYILDRIIIRNYKVLSKIESEIDSIEINILKNPDNKQLNKLIKLTRQIYKIRKYLNPLRYIGDTLLINDNSVLKEEYIYYFDNLNNKLDKLMLALESLVQDMAIVREAFEAQSANKTNDLMKIFAIIATVFLPLNFITGMYGMNVKNMPLTNLRYGYYYILIIMVIICVWLIRFCKRKNWL